MKIYEVTDPEFAAYGRILEGVDLTGMVEALKKTPCPEDGTIYVPGDPELEKLPEVIISSMHWSITEALSSILELMSFI